MEKILSRQESLPSDWPVSGTTGYDYLNEANGLFVEPEGARRMEEIYSTFIGRRQNFAEVVYQKKKLVMNTLLRSRDAQLWGGNWPNLLRRIVTRGS